MHSGQLAQPRVAGHSSARPQMLSSQTGVSEKMP